MKTAEEFVPYLDSLNTKAAIAAIKARDIAMWEQGMTDAAGIAEANHRKNSSIFGLIEIPYLYKTQIEVLIKTARDHNKNNSV